MRGVPEPVEFRFGRGYEIQRNGCWIWTGACNSNGYGTFNPSPTVKVYAHRWSYEWVNGPVPDGLELDHLCRTPLCVNPSHLEPVTRDENMRRRAEAQTSCVHGHPFTAANTYRPPSRPNRRMCRQCMRSRPRRTQTPVAAVATEHPTPA